MQTLRDSNVEMLHSRINLICAATSLFSVCHAFAPSSVIRGKLILNMQSEHNEKNVPSFTDLEEIRSIAMIAAKRAGEIILSNSSGMDVSKTKANARDLLTVIDPLCEQTIKETILGKYPSHDFLGEEDVPPGKEASTAALNAKLMTEKEFLWIVDPIDGTSNFVHGMPLCMPSIACAHRGEVVIGVIYDPHRDEMFTGMKGFGAEMNGCQIHVGKQDSMSEAIVAMGSPPAESSLNMSLLGIKALMPKVRTIRMLGSAALMLAWVANGRLTCYWEYDLSSWDIAAGALIVKEAGGRFSDLENVDFDLRNRKIIASNKLVHDEILSALHEGGVR